MDKKLISKRIAYEIVMLISILGVGGYIAYIYCMRGFDLLAMSFTADGGYRYFLGQIPYKDFHINTGPVLYYLQGLFFKIYGGFYWRAVALHAAVLSMFASLVIFITLRFYLGSIASFGFTIIALLTFSLPRGYPWVESIAFLFYLIAVGIFCFANRFAYKLNFLILNILSALSGLVLTIVLFSKHNIGFAALGFMSLLWLLVPFSNTEKFTDRLLRFFSCILTTVFSTVFLMLYFGRGDSFFYEDILVSSGLLYRLYQLLPTYAIKDWLSYHYGYTVILIYFSIPVLFIAFSYLSNLKLKTIIQQEWTLISVTISIILFNYVSHFTSEAGSHTALGLVSLELGLIYAILSRLQKSYSHIKIDRKKFSKFCSVATFVTAITVLLFILPILLGMMPSFVRSKLITLLLFFPLLLVIIIAVFFFILWILNYQRYKRVYLIGSFLKGFKIYIAMLAISAIAYFAPIFYLDNEGRPWKLMSNHSWNVKFKNIPALEDVYADRHLVETIEKLVKWFQPKLAENPSLRNGSEICILGMGKSLYGILGIQSFKGVHLSLMRGVTKGFKRIDTNTIINKAPQYIIYYPYDRHRNLFKISPRLGEFVKRYYRIVAQFNGIFIFQHMNKN